MVDALSSHLRSFDHPRNELVLREIAHGFPIVPYSHAVHISLLAENVDLKPRREVTQAGVARVPRAAGRDADWRLRMEPDGGSGSRRVRFAPGATGVRQQLPGEPLSEQFMAEDHRLLAATVPHRAVGSRTPRSCYRTGVARRPHEPARQRWPRHVVCQCDRTSWAPQSMRHRAWLAEDRGAHVGGGWVAAPPDRIHLGPPIAHGD
jgi:hypothetical protein